MPIVAPTKTSWPLMVQGALATSISRSASDAVSASFSSAPTWMMAAQPCNGIPLSHTPFQPASDLFQQVVADWMPEGIIDFLKTIEIDAEHGNLAGALDALERRLQPFAKKSAVR